MGLETGSDVALAFGLVIAAGLSTTVGAAFAFCAKLADARTLSIALGSSAGVMIYVSFGEIFLVKSVDGFADAGYGDDAAMRYATFCFFAGLLITALLNGIVHLICRENQNAESDNQVAASIPNGHAEVIESKEDSTTDVEMADCNGNLSPCCVEKYADVLDADKQAHHLQQVGLMSGLAIALHNFPEGLATFVGTLADPTAGVAIAVAIALHNIPEGVVVAMPVYYATKSRFRGFMWAFLSGVSEPIGALFGWIILSNLGDLAYAIMFAVVAGMMVYISVRELIPTALRFDPTDQWVTVSIFFGMAVMAASLLLFNV